MLEVPATPTPTAETLKARPNEASAAWPAQLRATKYPTKICHFATPLPSFLENGTNRRTTRLRCMRHLQYRTLALSHRPCSSTKLKFEGLNTERLLPSTPRLLPVHLGESPARCLRKDVVPERPMALLPSRSKLSTLKSFRMPSRRSCSLLPELAKHATAVK